MAAKISPRYLTGLEKEWTKFKYNVMYKCLSKEHSHLYTRKYKIITNIIFQYNKELEYTSMVYYTGLLPVGASVSLLLLLLSV